MITDKEALQAAKTLRKYCEDHGFCNRCIFSGGDLHCNDVTPDDWELPQSDLPAAIKDHLMRRFMTVE